MDDDDRDLARRLFVAVTERLETAHEVATEGQGHLNAEYYAALAHRLLAVADEIITLAASVIVITGQSDGGENIKNQA